MHPRNADTRNVVHFTSSEELCNDLNSIKFLECEFCLSKVDYLTFQLQIKRVDPFKNGSCYEEDTLEAGSIYNKRHKGSTYTVQVCFALDFFFVCLWGLLEKWQKWQK